MSKEIQTTAAEYRAMEARDQGMYDDYDYDDQEPAFDDEPEAEEKPYIGPWTVCIFLIDQAYGGAEEGGWWYTYGDPVFTTHMKVFSDLQEAWKYVYSLDEELDRMNEGRPKISDTNSIGRFDARICNGWPKAFPDRIPRYE